MRAPQSPAAAAVSRVRTALDATVAALARPDVDALLAAESGLSAAFADLATLRTLAADDRRLVQDDLLAARAALHRARRLGASLTDFIGLSLQAQGHAAGYEPARSAAATLNGRGFQARV
jgi:hypothetical protein